MRVLNLWQKNGVFKIEVIQPLLDMAAGSSSSAGMDNGPDGGKALIRLKKHYIQHIHRTLL